jgi:hypothetical protein
MKKKLLFSLIFLFFFLFLALGGWLPTAIRLDTGDAPGANRSIGGVVKSNGDNVYVVWWDERNGGEWSNSDIYFNYSKDRGLTWQSTDIRLDTGDTPGANRSSNGAISSSDNNVYVVWYDYRNGECDIYFNSSTDGGTTWQSTDLRLDTGDTPGASRSWYPQISSSGNDVYVVWYDYRNGECDIYFNSSIDGGTTWESTDLRLDTGDIPGANASYFPQISSSGSNVYVVWMDERDGNSDIYYNSSTDGGETWQTKDIRLDTGDTPGANISWRPQISSNGDNVYVVWWDERNGWGDIYFNSSTDGGATWQSTDLRLDTGDAPGAGDSFTPQISNCGSSVYVVWSDDRNGENDIYFNSSADGGIIWQSTDLRLDTGDIAGASGSFAPQISNSDSSIYVTWQDYRSGQRDIYFNYSTDGGVTWQEIDARIDIGDIAGASDSLWPQISNSGSNVYIVWMDERNGNSDIYFNTNSAVDPLPDIKANGSDGPITITHSDLLTITVEFDAGDYSGVEADWFLVAMTPLGWYHYALKAGWIPGREVTFQTPLRDVPSREVLNMSGLPAGDYTFYFGVDLLQNGLISMRYAFYDRVSVTINP